MKRIRTAWVGLKLSPKLCLGADVRRAVGGQSPEGVEQVSLLMSAEKVDEHVWAWQLQAVMNPKASLRKIRQLQGKQPQVKKVEMPVALTLITTKMN